MMGIIAFPFIVLIGAWLLLTTWFIVKPREGRLVQRFGGTVVNEATSAGIYFKMPFPLSTVTRAFSLSQEHITETIRIKTMDEVFLNLRLTAFFERDENNLESAVFNLSDPYGQMKFIMAEAAKEVATNMDVKNIYSDKENIQTEVLKSMRSFFEEHGFHMIKITVEDPIMDAEVEEASNRIYAAKRDREAAKIEKEAIITREVASAEANAQSLKLRTKAAGEARKEFAEEMANAVNKFKETSPETPVEYLFQTLEGIDLRDAIINSADKPGNMTIVAMGNNDHGSLNQMPLTQAVAKQAVDNANSSSQ